MTVKAANPKRVLQPRLTRFEERWAGAVLSWARSQGDQYWLAPRTVPPLSTEKILAWAGEDRHSFCLIEKQDEIPASYGEINVLQSHDHEYWLGHLIVDPKRRCRGLGRLFTRMLLRHAFHEFRAERVSLVVFPENTAAVKTYRSAGMVEDGYETHTFKPYNRQEKLLRLVAAPGAFGR